MTPSIDQAIGAFLERVTERFERQLESDLLPVQRLVEHVAAYRGKMLRPTLVALCGSAARPDEDELTEAHVITAAVCEMVHMATLVHDDVLDEADVRRKGATVNRLAGNEAAVILGDYLFTAAYHLCAQLEDQTTARLVAQTGMTLCGGELLQLDHRGDVSIDEATYFELIDRKTASLIAIACDLGAMHSGAENATRHALSEFGRKLGCAFQLQDDLLDLTGDERVVGKPVGRDTAMGKLTLPLIHHLATADDATRGETLELLNGAGLDAAAAAPLAPRLETTGSMGYARARARELVESAQAGLGSLPPSAARDALHTMSGLVITRNA